MHKKLLLNKDFLGCEGVVRIFKKIPKFSLSWGTKAGTKIFNFLFFVRLFWQKPLCPIVSVLTTRLHVKVIEAPVCQFLGEILYTNLEGKTEFSYGYETSSSDKVTPAGKCSLPVL